jgi:hypothetical protein
MIPRRNTGVALRSATSRPDAANSSFLSNVVLSIVTIMLLGKSVHAQLGTTICICSPAIYTMTLNFTGNCENDALIGDGISTSDCAIDPFQNDNVTDEVPVSVGSIDILELDENLVLLTQSSRFGSFGNGDIIQFASISNDPSMINETFYPTALQVSMIGSNADGESLFFAGLIVYSTECDQFPLILNGSSVGWITLVRCDYSLFFRAMNFCYCHLTVKEMPHFILSDKFN